MKTSEEQFLYELKNLSGEIETILKLRLIYMTIKKIAGRNKDVLEILNYTPRIWTTISYAMQCSYFIALGRIFDNNTEHNVDKVLKIAQNNVGMFSKEALKKRKMQGSENAHEWIDNYLVDIYEPTIEDFRKLRKLVTKYRKIYEQGYKNIRHKVFAHKELIDEDDIAKLFKNTSHTGTQEISDFLSQLHYALWNLFYNGRKPVLSEAGKEIDFQKEIVYDVEKLLTVLEKSKRLFSSHPAHH